MVGFVTIGSACASPTLEQRMETLCTELELPRDAPLDHALARARERFGLPGIAASVVSSSEVLERGVAGYADTERKIALAPHHRFDINSVTKSFTALLIAHLVEDERLDYDRTVVEVFPDLAGRLHTDYSALTIDELIRHTSGLSRNGRHIAASERPPFGESRVENRSVFSRWVLTHPAAATRGEFNYSNAGYVVLGAIVEETTGRSWETEVTERVFEPLDMTSGSFGWLGGDPAEYAIGHSRRSGGSYVQRSSHDDWYLYGASFPAGGIHLSIDDLATYARYHLNGLDGRVDHLSAETFRGLHRVEGLYARGWFDSEFDSFAGSVHDGSDDGYYSKVFVSSESGLGIAVLTNIDDENAWLACSLVSYWLLKKHAEPTGEP